MQPPILCASEVLQLCSAPCRCGTAGPFTTSRAILEIVRGLALTDTWIHDHLRPTFTHHSPTGSTRHVRFYMTNDLLGRKTGIEMPPAAFTGHLAFVLRFSIPTIEVRKQGRSKMDPGLMS
jgi:hypothetical protein